MLVDNHVIVNEARLPLVNEVHPPGSAAIQADRHRDARHATRGIPSRSVGRLDQRFDPAMPFNHATPNASRKNEWIETLSSAVRLNSYGSGSGRMTMMPSHR